MPGKAVKDFSLPSTGGKTFSLSSTLGKQVVLYFYPKDNTPGCSAEGADFRDRYKAFAKTDCEVYGISRDSLKSHESFKAKTKFPLRSPLGRRGDRMHAVRRHKLPGHAEEVFNFVNAL